MAKRLFVIEPVPASPLSSRRRRRRRKTNSPLFHTAGRVWASSPSSLVPTPRRLLGLEQDGRFFCLFMSIFCGAHLSCGVEWFRASGGYFQQGGS